VVSRYRLEAYAWADEGIFSRFGKERGFSLVLVLVVVLVLERLSYA
jgi:hypothetical protein